ncbi:alpha/beta hydrolase fold domain-containing protein [Nocardia otitidiscaviarum]|nr:alpha/beta hydrolase fold domain-containing protein [Nocardia otitidiscaviarum]MBF6181777.1 alpha/beta hydrolase fold domain-containing protein [Nocardia otitidiscaviarum]MBF6488071.1 alpha/beta hydrolase fold domain-containing protein [Nocardia otitidiscaviarum]
MRVTCSPRTHRRPTGELSARSEFPMIAVAYQKSLRNRFPAANDDAWRGYRWLNSRADGGRLAIVGDSAGRYQAVATPPAATRGAPKGGCHPQSALLALNPLTDATLKLERMRGRLQKGPPPTSAAVGAIGLYTANPSARVFAAGRGRIGSRGAALSSGHQVGIVSTIAKE